MSTESEAVRHALVVIDEDVIRAKPTREVPFAAMKRRLRKEAVISALDRAETIDDLRFILKFVMAEFVL